MAGEGQPVPEEVIGAVESLELTIATASLTGPRRTRESETSQDSGYSNGGPHEAGRRLSALLNLELVDRVLAECSLTTNYVHTAHCFTSLRLQISGGERAIGGLVQWRRRSSLYRYTILYGR